MGQKGDYVMLEVKNLTFQVQENGVERSIVENISFDVADGEMLVITGPNGGGKSTLAKIIAGIIKPTAIMISITEQMQESVMHFSSHRDLKE